MVNGTTYSRNGNGELDYTDEAGTPLNLTGLGETIGRRYRYN